MTSIDTLEVILYFHYEYVGAIWWYFCKSFVNFILKQNVFRVKLIFWYITSNLRWFARLKIVHGTGIQGVFLQCAMTLATCSF